MNIYRIFHPIKWHGEILKTGQLSAEAEAVAGLVKSGALVLELENVGESVGGQDEQKSVAIAGTAQNLQTDGTGGKPEAPEPDEAAASAVALEADLTVTQEPASEASEPDEATASAVALEADLTVTQESAPEAKGKGKAK